MAWPVSSTSGSLRPTAGSDTCRPASLEHPTIQPNHTATQRRGNFYSRFSPGDPHLDCDLYQQTSSDSLPATIPDPDSTASFAAHLDPQTRKHTNPGPYGDAYEHAIRFGNSTNPHVDEYIHFST